MMFTMLSLLLASCSGVPKSVQKKKAIEAATDEAEREAYNQVREKEWTKVRGYMKEYFAHNCDDDGEIEIHTTFIDWDDIERQCGYLIDAINDIQTSQNALSIMETDSLAFEKPFLELASSDPVHADGELPGRQKTYDDLYFYITHSHILLHQSTMNFFIPFDRDSDIADSQRPAGTYCIKSGPIRSRNGLCIRKMTVTLPQVHL